MHRSPASRSVPRGGEFRLRYGPVAVIAGAAQGLGQAFAEEVASRGVDLVLLDRLEGELSSLAERLRGQRGVVVQTQVVDLAAVDAVELLEGLRDAHDPGLFVCNAARASIGLFVSRPIDVLREQLELNCWLPLAAGRVLGPRMIERGAGGLVFVSSLSGLQGSALVASYAATKAFDLVLAEGLWEELRGEGVDVVACVPGPIDTPGWRASAPRASRLAPRAAPPRRVAERALDALGRRPSVLPGGVEVATAFLMQRLLPRRLAVKILGRQMRRMYGER